MRWSRCVSSLLSLDLFDRIRSLITTASQTDLPSEINQTILSTSNLQRLSMDKSQTNIGKQVPSIQIHSHTEIQMHMKINRDYRITATLLHSLSKPSFPTKVADDHWTIFLFQWPRQLLTDFQNPSISINDIKLITFQLINRYRSHHCFIVDLTQRITMDVSIALHFSLIYHLTTLCSFSSILLSLPLSLSLSLSLSSSSHLSLSLSLLLFIS